MKKQSLLIIAALFLTSLTTYGQYIGYVGDIAYYATSPYEVQVWSYDDEGGHVNITRYYQSWFSTYDVTRINDSAFRNKGLTGVTIPNSVNSIGGSAFRGNDLTIVTIGGNVASIGNNAFRDNNLTEVTIPGGVEVIGGWAFADNPNLARVIPGSAAPPTIAGRTFENANRNQIDVVVPRGAKAAYKNPANGWREGRTMSVYLKQYGKPVLIAKQVFKNGDGSTGTLYLATSDLNLGYQSLTAIYEKRWKVEEFFRSIKNNTAFAKAPTKTIKTQQAHFMASIIAFIKLERLKTRNSRNHYAVKSKIWLAATRAAWKQLDKLSVPNVTLDKIAA